VRRDAVISNLQKLVDRTNAAKDGYIPVSAVGKYLGLHHHKVVSLAMGMGLRVHYVERHKSYTGQKQRHAFLRYDDAILLIETFSKSDTSGLTNPDPWTILSIRWGK
jgi:hypothetical protein